MDRDATGSQLPKIHMDHHSVHAAPIIHPTITLPRLQASLALPHRGRTPLPMAANVVANCCVGFELPLTVTVGADAGDGCVLFGDEDAGRMVKRGEVACITPCVELMKIRK